MRTFGLIPAAGKSRRMGQPKLLLQLGATSVLELVVSAVRDAGVTQLLVVVAPGADALAERAESAGAHVLRLAEDTLDMRATCLHGLAWIEKRFQPNAEDGWLLLPADHPTVRPDVIRAILTVAREQPSSTIVVPTCHGRRGHPTWLRWQHVSAMRKLTPDQAFNTYIRQRCSETLELSWPRDDILRDLDTPKDYQQLLEELRIADCGMRKE